MRFISLLILSAIIFTGCETLSVSKMPPQYMFIRSYEAEQFQEANTGTIMWTVESKHSLPSYSIQEEYKPAELPIIAPEQEWVARYSLGGNYIINTNKYPYQRMFGIEIKPSGELASEKPFIQLNNFRRPVQDKWRFWESCRFIPLEGHTLHSGYFKGELTYTGKTEDSISIAYREYVNYVTRPSHEEELRYDLNESDVIVFRSLKIKVLEANNERIRFQVIDDGGLPWVPKNVGPQP